MDSKTAVETLRRKLFEFSPNIPDCKPMSITRCNEIASLIETLQAQNERLRKIEEKARAVIEARKTMKHIERSSSFFELIATLNKLQDALKGGR